MTTSRVVAFVLDGPPVLGQRIPMLVGFFTASVRHGQTDYSITLDGHGRVVGWRQEGPRL